MIKGSKNIFKASANLYLEGRPGVRVARFEGHILHSVQSTKHNLKCFYHFFCISIGSVLLHYSYEQHSQLKIVKILPYNCSCCPALQGNWYLLAVNRDEIGNEHNHHLDYHHLDSGWSPCMCFSWAMREFNQPKGNLSRQLLAASLTMVVVMMMVMVMLMMVMVMPMMVTKMAAVTVNNKSKMKMTLVAWNSLATKGPQSP